ncbi:MAG: hypothetical protein ACJ8C4_17645 [Gemmataceae bacterium]
MWEALAAPVAAEPEGQGLAPSVLPERFPGGAVHLLVAAVVSADRVELAAVVGRSVRA